MAIPIRMIKPWRPLTPEEADKVAGNLGVYQLANDAGEVLYIGAATGRSLKSRQKLRNRRKVRPSSGWRSTPATAPAIANC